MEVKEQSEKRCYFLVTKVPEYSPLVLSTSILFLSMVSFENSKLVALNLSKFVVLFDVTSLDTGLYDPEFMMQILEANFLPPLLLHVV